MRLDVVREVQLDGQSEWQELKEAQRSSLRCLPYITTQTPHGQTNPYLRATAPTYTHTCVLHNQPIRQVDPGTLKLFTCMTFHYLRARPRIQNLGPIRHGMRQPERWRYWSVNAIHWPRTRVRGKSTFSRLCSCIRSVEDQKTGLLQGRCSRVFRTGDAKISL